MYDQHIILDFEMNPVVKKYTEAESGCTGKSSKSVRPK